MHSYTSGEKIWLYSEFLYEKIWLFAAIFSEKIWQNSGFSVKNIWLDAEIVLEWICLDSLKDATRSLQSRELNADIRRSTHVSTKNLFQTGTMEK